MAGQFFVELPPRRPQRGGLLAVAEVIEETTGRSAMGLEFIEDTCLPPSLAPGDCWADYSPVDGTEKTGSELGGDGGKSFAIYSGVECFMHSDDDFEERAERALLAGQGIAIEEVIFQYLGATAAAATVATSLIDALAQAESAGGKMPMLPLIHASRRVVTLLGDEIQADGEGMATRQRTPVANGGGYADVAAPSVGASIFVTGPVTIWLGPVVVNRTHDHVNNRTLAIAERTVAFAVECSVTEFATTAFPEETP